MLKLKITKNNIIVILSILLIMLSFLIKINDIYSIKKEKQNDEKIVKEVINNDKVKTTTIQSNIPITEVKTNKMNNYVAVLGIPKIGLKKGLVMATKNFKSINYAISIDRHSQMPDRIGNFILYAHSGNSKIAYFDKLDKLSINDEVNVFYNNLWYTYNIINIYEVNKTGNISIYNDSESKYITLTTCSQKNKGKQIIIIRKESEK